MPALHFFKHDRRLSRSSVVPISSSETLLPLSSGTGNEGRLRRFPFAWIRVTRTLGTRLQLCTKDKSSGVETAVRCWHCLRHEIKICKTTGTNHWECLIFSRPRSVKYLKYGVYGCAHLWGAGHTLASEFVTGFFSSKPLRLQAHLSANENYYSGLRPFPHSTFPFNLLKSSLDIASQIQIATGSLQTSFPRLHSSQGS